MLADPSSEVTSTRQGVADHRPVTGIECVLAAPEASVMTAGTDENLILTPPLNYSLEQSLEFLDDDELLEVTPHNLRLRKKLLTEVDRKRESRQKVS